MKFLCQQQVATVPTKTFLVFMKFEIPSDCSESYVCYLTRED
jgi:hypothetical protein